MVSISKISWIHNIGNLFFAKIREIPGPATLYLTSGDTEERTYENGQLHGIATFVSNNGDRYVAWKNKKFRDIAT